MKVCSVEKCGKETKHNNSPYCYAHYMKNWRYGTPTPEHAKFRKDLTGNRIGKLTVVSHRSTARWNCICDCGTEVVRSTGDLNRSVRRGTIATCGPDNGCRRITDAGYSLVHQRIRFDRGPASAFQCINNCGVNAQHWAYDHCDPYEVYSDHPLTAGIAYSRDVNRYVPLCAKCHKRFDMDRVMEKRASFQAI
jgi:hypothetical protein